MKCVQEQIPKEISVQSEWGDLLVNEGFTKLSAKIPIQNKEIFLISSLFSVDESNTLVNEAEKFGFGSTDYRKDYRGNLRLITEDKTLAVSTWSRLESLLPKFVEEEGHKYEVVGLNSRWRLAKYFPGDRFAPHVDAFYEDDSAGFGEGRKSMFTVNIYMNEDFTGGNTTFLFKQPVLLTKDDNNIVIDEPDQNAKEPTSHEIVKSASILTFDVVPKTGLALIFRQPPAQSYKHEGQVLESGVKYLFRSDVMYKIVS